MTKNKTKKSLISLSASTVLDWIELRPLTAHDSHLRSTQPPEEIHNLASRRAGAAGGERHGAAPLDAAAGSNGLISFLKQTENRMKAITEVYPEIASRITAGAGAIGRVMAQSFDADGAKLWDDPNNADALAQCPDHWRKSCLDVTDESSVSSLFEELVTEWGSVDTLCSNAGIAGPGNPIEDVALADWRACVSVLSLIHI